MKRTFIIAEAGVNHNGSLELAKKLVDAASKTGVDAVKFQTFCAEKIVSTFAPKAEYQTQTTNSSESQLEMIRKLELSKSDYKELIAYSNKKNIEFFSTAFDLESVDLVTALGVKRLKIPSGEITNAPLLLKVARTGLPIIMSTGMSTIGEIEYALCVLAFGMLHKKRYPNDDEVLNSYFSAEGKTELKDKVTLLHCTSEYPAPFDEVNLNAIKTISSTFGLNVGYSDHTQGTTVSIAAVACGATIIEKHFTLDRTLPGPDHISSVEPDELCGLVSSIRQVERALGCARKIVTSSEMNNRFVARKSIVAAHNIKKGELLTEKNITTKRPNNGISPMYFWKLLGKKAKRNYKMNEPIETVVP